jgi:hypothetical protein
MDSYTVIEETGHVGVCNEQDNGQPCGWKSNLSISAEDAALSVEHHVREAHGTPRLETDGE